MAELQSFHERALRINQVENSLVATKVSDDLYLVPNGKSLAQLRESYGFSEEGGGTDLYLWHEEALYAKGKGLLNIADDN